MEPLLKLIDTKEREREGEREARGSVGGGTAETDRYCKERGREGKRGTWGNAMHFAFHDL